MPQDAFTENQMKKKFFQITTLENQLNQIAEMLLEKKKIELDHLDAQQLERTFHTRNSEVLLITK